MVRISLVLVIVIASWSSTAWACSVFAGHGDGEVIAGNNEDYYGGDPTIMWFVPPEEGKHGYVAWGYESNHFAQGGMNDRGLFFDGLATPALTIENCTGTQPFTLMTMEEVMQDSATVAEAIANLEEYDYSQVLESAQFLIADANGDSAVFEGDITITPDGDSQFALNFYWSDPSLGYYPDWREQILEQMLAPEAMEVTVDYFTQVADAVHQGEEPGPGVYTRYVTIGDLARAEFYLYYDLDFENYLKFNLEEELSQGPHEYSMAELFADEETPDAGQEEEDAGTNADGGSSTETNSAGSDCGCSLIGTTRAQSGVFSMIESLI